MHEKSFNVWFSVGKIIPAEKINPSVAARDTGGQLKKQTETFNKAYEMSPICNSLFASAIVHQGL